jgi:tryptophan synthase alpha chain
MTPMPNRIKQSFADLKSAGRCALVTYVTAGDPGPQATLGIMRSLVASGADVIELGVPFSDPMADGATIQRAAERALKNGMSLPGVLAIVRAFREGNSTTPVVLMGYLNPIEAMGYANFVEQAGAAGVDGVLIVDVPPEEAGTINPQLVEGGLDQIFLVAPNSSPARIDNVCKFASGFVYYVAVKGVTGSKAIDSGEVRAHIREFRERLSLPIGVGFGIRSPESAAAVAAAGDAVIVGSAIIEIIERHSVDLTTMQIELGLFVAQLRDALDNARAA